MSLYLFRGLTCSKPSIIGFCRLAGDPIFSPESELWFDRFDLQSDIHRVVHFHQADLKMKHRLHLTVINEPQLLDNTPYYMRVLSSSYEHAGMHIDDFKDIIMHPVSTNHAWTFFSQSRDGDPQTSHAS